MLIVCPNCSAGYLLMTGFADQRERACGLDALIHDVLTKPFALADLGRAVDEAIRAGQRE